MIKQRIKKIRDLINHHDLDGYLVPKNDEYFSEYAFPNRIKTISNFSGSAGFAIILKKINYLFVDGRYTTQAKIESGDSYKILEIPQIFPHNLFNNNIKNIKIGFDPKLFCRDTLKRYFKDTCDLRPIQRNLVDLIYVEKTNIKGRYFYSLNEQITGEKIYSKINKLFKILNKKKIDNIFISAPENVAWLLNLRGKDNPNSPMPNCRLILSKEKKIYLFSEEEKYKKIKNSKEYRKIVFKNNNDFFSVLNGIKGNTFCIDKLTCSIFFESIIKSKFKILSETDPCYDLKSIKNPTEIRNMKKAHIEDGVALTKFLYWIKNRKLNGLDELHVEKKLERFRKKNKNYLYPSFNTIAGSGPNGAIIHYRANKKSNRKIKISDLLLCDSGGQYKYGTTDVTRTICFKKPKEKIKNIFTRVLKGHIAVATTNLNKINTGYIIDKKARYWLNKINLDYGHGTGHGVGFFLNVHEGPQSLSKYNRVPIKQGMIISNEPGYYEVNKFGIRIENLVYVEKNKNKLFFKNLTLAPIDNDLINFKMLDSEEKKYLFKYHWEVYSKISKYLTKNEKSWMQNLI